MSAHQLPHLFLNLNMHYADVIKEELNKSNRTLSHGSLEVFTK